MSQLQVARIVSCSQNWAKRHGPIPEWDSADIRRCVRHLDNPYYEPELTDLCGLDAPVQAFITAQPEWLPLHESLVDAIRDMWSTGQEVATVAVRCQGGHDRSVDRTTDR